MKIDIDRNMWCLKENGSVVLDCICMSDILPTVPEQTLCSFSLPFVTVRFQDLVRKWPKF